MAFDPSGGGSEHRQLLTSLREIFPRTPVQYLEEQCEDLVGKPAAIDRLIDELTTNDSKPPDSWSPGLAAGVAADPQEQMDQEAIVQSIREQDPKRRKRDENRNINVLGKGETGGTSTDTQSPGTSQDKRRQAIQANIEEDSSTKRLSTLVNMFPTVDPDFLQKKGQEFGFGEGSEERLNHWVEANIDKGYKQFPTRADYEKKKLNDERRAALEGGSGEATVTEVLEMLGDLCSGDPAAFFSKPRQVSDTYRTNSWHQLLKHFPNLPLDVITKVYQENESLFVPCAAKLRNKHSSRRPRPTQEVHDYGDIDSEFFKEYRYWQIKDQVTAHLQSVEKQRAEHVRIAGEAGALMTCLTCFADDCLEEDMTACPSGHLFCRDCLRRASEVAIGDAKVELKCLGQCDSPFDLAALQKALKPTMFEKWLKAIQASEMEKAGLEGLENCPFCPYSTIMDTSPEEDKVFVCRNPDCGKDSCRLCREPSHIPQRCDEIEKDAEVKKRTAEENKKSEELMRKCPSCGKVFIKESGCNRMKCECGAEMCYVCKKTITNGYDHFYNDGRHIKAKKSDTRQCPLWSPPY